MLFAVLTIKGSSLISSINFNRFVKNYLCQAAIENLKLDML